MPNNSNRKTGTTEPDPSGASTTYPVVNYPNNMPGVTPSTKGGRKTRKAKMKQRRQRNKRTRRVNVRQRGGELTLTGKTNNQRGFVHAAVERTEEKKGCLPPPGWFSTWSRTRGEIYYEPLDGSSPSRWDNPAGSCTPAVLPPVGWRLVNVDGNEVYYENPVTKEKMANL